jgi:hypothetical protein
MLVAMGKGFTHEPEDAIIFGQGISEAAVGR